MGFLNPGLLWFMAGGSIPVIIHLLHRQRFRRVRWAAMDFLLAALKKTQRRMRLENLLLLLIRILIMIILAMAIAKPFFEEPPIGALAETNTHYVIVIDNSYSMGFKKSQRTSLDAAKKAAEEIVLKKHTSEQDRFTVLLMSDYPEILVPETNKKDNVVKAIKDIRLADYGTSMHRSMIAVQDILDRSRRFRREIYILTDFQRIAWEPPSESDANKFKMLLKRLSGRDQTKFYLLDAGTRDADNYALVSLRIEGRPMVTTRRTANFAVDIYNYSDASIETKPITLYIDGNPVETRTTFVEANTITTIKFDYDFVEAGHHSVEAKIEPDFLGVDDTRHLAVRVRRTLKALVIDGEPGNNWEGEAYAYTFVLDPAGDGRSFEVDSTTSELFTAEEIEKYDFIVLANVEDLEEEKIERLEQFVQNGGGLFFALGDQVNPVSYNEYLWKEGKGLLPAELDEPSGDPDHENPRHLVNVKYDHPMFITFRDKLRGAPYDLIFYEYWSLKAPTADEPDELEEFNRSVLARFDDNHRSPAILERKFGEGKVVMMTTPIDQEWSESIIGRPPYFVIMRNLSEHLAARSLSRTNLMVGEPIQVLLPITDYKPNFDLTTPDGSVVTAPAKRLPKTDKWFIVEYPTQTEGPKKESLHNEGIEDRGIWKLTKQEAEESELPLAYFAANISPRDTAPESLHRCEGNLDRMGFDEIKQRYPDFKCTFIGSRGSKDESIDIDTPPGGMWRFLLYLLMGFLLIEMTMAWLFGRAKQ